MAWPYLSKGLYLLFWSKAKCDQLQIYVEVVSFKMLSLIDFPYHWERKTNPDYVSIVAQVKVLI